MSVRDWPFVRAIPHLLILSALISGAVIVKQWAYATTFHLFLNQRVDDSPGSAATQRFDLEDGRVVPRILMHDDRVVFRANIGQDSTIRAAVQTAPGAGVEVRLHQDGDERVVARAGGTRGTIPIAVPFPHGNGEIELVSHGSVTWADLRIERGVHVTRPLACLALLVAALSVWRLTLGRTGPAEPAPVALSRGRRFWFSALTVCTSVLVSLLILEAGLRAIGNRLPPGITALRHDLGEPTEDPRWQQTARYGQRLRPNVDLPSQWRYGDIIRMGFVPPAAGEGVLHRYPFHADREGFRNPAVRDPISVAALGDSFTDALTMRREDAWPAQLEARIGQPVQNYGTAGFGPQQELLVLTDFALTHHPKTVVLAFFAGNDIRDAEVFESVQRAQRPPNQPQPGWPIKTIVTRADRWFLTSALQAATRVLATAQESDPGPQDASSHVEGRDGARGSAGTGPGPSGASFSRGVFTAAVNGRTLKWALMPPYLNLLNFDEANLSARRGWTLIEENLVEMQRRSREAGADFIVAFIPFKSQVYWPILERSFDAAALAEALRFYVPDTGAVPDVDRMSRNRLAQNILLEHFCRRAGIPLLDLTPTLQARTEAGETMYFPDDSHLNEAGEAEVAAAVEAFLRARGALK